MTAIDQVRFLAAGQPAGTSERYQCPKCLGGTMEEESLSVTIDTAGGVHWICFRSTCGYKGGPRGVRPSYTPGKGKKEPRPYTRPYYPLTPGQVALVEWLYGDDMAAAVTGYTVATDRFILPVDGPLNTRGYLARSLSGDEPKSLTYNEKPNEPFIHFTYPQYGNPTTTQVVVEDWFSAEKVALAGYIGVSLNGTNLNQEMVNELVEQARGVRCPILTVIALDKDAFSKTLQYVHKYRDQFPYGLKAASLQDDLKYLTPEQICGAVDNGRYEFPRKDSHQRTLIQQGQL